MVTDLALSALVQLAVLGGIPKYLLYSAAISAIAVALLPGNVAMALIVAARAAA